MRVLHVTDHYAPVLGGIETHVEALALRQAWLGHDVTVLTSSGPTADGRHSDDTGPVTVRRAGSLRSVPRVDPASYDVVHAHLSVVAPFTSPLVARIARQGAPTVVTVHSLWSGLGPVPAAAAQLAGLRTAPVHWTAVSRVAAQELGRRLPRGTRVDVLPNAVDVAPRGRPARVPDGAVRMVSTMRIARRKRPLALLRMFEQVARTVDVPVRLTIVGDGPLRPAVERVVRRDGLADLVTVTGRVDPAEVLEVVAGAEVYVAPAVLESFGLAALEARSLGLPVVGRASSGLTEFVRHGTEGLLCASDADMVGRLRDLVVDPRLRHRLAEHNRCVPSTKTWAHTLGEHERVYRRARAAAGSPLLSPASEG